MIPEHAGWYWARERGYTHYNLLVRVTGVAPFFHTECVDVYCMVETSNNISEWGPEVIIPEVEAE